MNFEEELYNLDVPEEHIPELLKFGKNNPEFYTKVHIQRCWRVD